MPAAGRPPRRQPRVTYRIDPSAGADVDVDVVPAAADERDGSHYHDDRSAHTTTVRSGPSPGGGVPGPLLGADPPLLPLRPAPVLRLVRLGEPRHLLGPTRPSGAVGPDNGRPRLGPRHHR